jgi:hypothetical protein
MANIAPGLEWVSNLSLLVGQKAIVTDAKGEAHELAPYTLVDLLDTKKLGSDWTARALGFTLDPDEWFYLLWLSMRHEGKTREECRAGKHAYTMAHVVDLFDGPPEKLNDLYNAVVKAIVTLLVVSGFIQPATNGGDKADPTKAAK